MLRIGTALSLALSLAFAAGAQDKPADSFKDSSPSGHITAISPNKAVHDSFYKGAYKFAPAVRAGDYVYLSGVVSGAYGATEALDAEGFKADLRKRFSYLQSALKAADASMADVVRMRTYHVFHSKWISIDKIAQINAVAAVKEEMMPAPHPAWTAVGVTELFSDTGLVEIELVAYAPLKKPQKD